jgi:hypothetical protein
MEFKEDDTTDNEGGDEIIESDRDRPSSEGDWSSNESDKPATKKPAAATEPVQPVDEGKMPEDDNAVPDVLDVNLPDWDLTFTFLFYAVLSGSLSVLDEFLAAGADAKLTTKASFSCAPALFPLFMALMRPDKGLASRIAERLVQNGASSLVMNDTADPWPNRTLLHRSVLAGKAKLISTILINDPNAAIAMNFPAPSWNNLTPPICSAIGNRYYSIVALLLAHGAKLVLIEADVECVSVGL